MSEYHKIQSITYADRSREETLARDKEEAVTRRKIKRRIKREVEKRGVEDVLTEIIMEGPILLRLKWGG